MFNATVTTHTPADGWTVRMIIGESYDRGDIVPAWGVDVQGPDGMVDTFRMFGHGGPNDARTAANAVWSRIRGGERPRGASCHADRPAVRRNPGDLARTMCAECEHGHDALERQHGV